MEGKSDFDELDLPPEELAAMSNNLPPEELAAMSNDNPQVTQAPAEWHPPEKKTISWKNELDKKDRDQASIYLFACLLLQLLNIFFSVLAFIIFTINCMVGIIPWAFYFLEFVALFPMAIVLITSITTMLEYTFLSVKYEPFKCREDFRFGNTVYTFLVCQCCFTVVIILGIITNFVIGIIPWAFYIIEIVNLLCIFVTAFISFGLVLLFLIPHIPYEDNRWFG